jgi:hypothetical protein
MQSIGEIQVLLAANTVTVSKPSKSTDVIPSWRWLMGYLLDITTALREK